MAAIELNIEIQPFADCLDEVQRLLENAPSGFIDKFNSLIQSGDQLWSIGQGSTSRAGEVLFTLDISDRFRKLLFALRASNAIDASVE